MSDSTSRRKTAYLILFGGLAVATLVIFIVIIVQIGESFAPTPLIRVREQVPLETARRTGIPIPDTAMNIRVAEYQEFLAYTFIMRFDLPPHEIDEFAKEWSRSEPPESEDSEEKFPEEPLPYSGGEIPDISPINVNWFRPDQIERGLYLRRVRKDIWFDLDTGAVYLMETD